MTFFTSENLSVTKALEGHFLKATSPEAPQNQILSLNSC
jgi:hypothetical protein